MKRAIFGILFLFVLINSQSQTYKTDPLSRIRPKTSKSLPKNFSYQTINASGAAHQKSALVDLASFSDVSYTYHSHNGLLMQVSGQLVTPQSNGQKDDIGMLNQCAQYFGIRNGTEELQEEFIKQSSLNGYRFKKYKQYYMGIPVYGSGLTIRFHNGLPDLAFGNIYPTPKLENIKTYISLNAAYDLAKNQVSKRYTWKSITDPLSLSLIGGSQFKATLEIYHLNYQKDAEALVWHVTIRPDVIHAVEYIIDVKSGEIIDTWDGHCSVNGPATASATDLKGQTKTINTYGFNNNYYMIDGAEPMFNASASSIPNNPVGAIWTLDAKNTDGSGSISHITSTTNSGWNSRAVSAHNNAKVSYDYFRANYVRNSINGTGGSILSIINVTESDGSAMDNAYWNGSAMFYGNGSSAFTPLAKALDVAGHELTHGVVQETANLEYKNQSGAINESMADIFGTLIEDLNWTIGEDITKKSYIATGALRDMSDPHNGGSSLNDNGWQPKLMREYYKGSQDNGGVHINSGIPNYAFYLIATQINKDKAGAIYYRALTTYLTATSNFLDLRYALVNAAGEIFGSGSNEVKVVKQSFDTVEIYDPNAGSGTPSNTGIDLSPNPGSNFILSYDVDYANATDRWWKSDTVPSGYLPLTTTRSKAPASVTDKGDKACYVGKDAKIHQLDLKASANYDAIIQNQAIWDNVAISKDGSKIAAVTAGIDSSIWVYDGSSWKKFVLYNPTTANGVNGAGVIYANALEWDYTGQYIVYDAYNELNNNGNPIGWWDVGMIKVWDLKTNKWGDGKVQKVFTNLAAGISIGNPAFSKNSPYILAFDYIDNNTGKLSVIGTNINTGTTKTITANSILSFPSYSRLDNKLLVSGEDLFGDTNIYVVPLKPSKIEGNGSGTKLIPYAKWAYWYATGTRSLLNGDKVITSFSFPNLVPAVNATINGLNISATLPFGTDVTKLIPTYLASPLASVYVSSVEQVSGASVNDFTNIVTYTVKAQDGTSQDYKVTVTLGAVKSNAKDIIDFSFQTLSPVVNGVISGTNILATVPLNTFVTSLKATFTLSAKATAKVGSTDQVSGVTANNFSSPVVYTIKAEDGSTKDYTVTVTKSNAINIVHIDLVNIWPNPVQDELNVRLPSGKMNISVFEAGGKLVYTKQLQSEGQITHTIDTRLWSQGIYIISLDNSESIYTQKIVK